MQLIKIGSTFVNLGNITEIHDLGDVVHIYFAIATGKGTTLDRTEVTGHEATALRWWLEQNSIDVLNAMQELEKQQQTPPATR